MSTNESIDEDGDATIVRPVTPQKSATSAMEVDDATIVRPVNVEPQFDEATMVRPRPIPHVSPSSNSDVDLDVDEDATVVRVLPAPHGAAAEDAVSEETASEDTAPRLSRRAARRNKAAAAVAAPVPVDSISSSVALPIEDPERRRWGSRKQQGLDPMRVISPVPGSAPWDPELMPERGVRRETTVVYGPRSKHMGDIHGGTDQVHAQLGDAPSAQAVQVRPARELLPSLERRARRSRRITLIAGGGVVAISIVGLGVIAMIAFG